MGNYNNYGNSTGGGNFNNNYGNSSRGGNAGQYGNNTRSNGNYNNSRPTSTAKNFKGQYVAHSGCKMETSYVSKVSGEVVNSPIIYGWNVGKGLGMVNFIASPKKKNKETGKSHLTKNKNWENWTVKLFIARTKETKFTNGLYDVRSKKLILPDMQMVANPKKNYFGTFVKK